MRIRFILKNFVLILYINSFLFSEQIPSNNLSNTTLNRWVVVKDDSLNGAIIKGLVKDPISYLKNNADKKTVDLGNQKDTPLQVYQLFENFNYNSSIIAISYIESPEKQETGLMYLDYDMDAAIYINGNLVMSEKKGDTNEFLVKMNKGKNTIIIIGDLIGYRKPSIFAWFYGSQRAEIVGTVRDINGNPVPFSRVFLLGKHLNNPYKRTDKNGKYRYWIHPNYGEYRIGSMKNKYHGYSDPIILKEYGRYKVDI